MFVAATFIDKAVSARTRLKAFGERYRTALALIAGLVFLAAVVWSASNLNVRLADLHLSAFAALVVFVLPLSILLNLLELRLCTSALGRAIDWRGGLIACTLGAASNILPLPASFAIRTKVLFDTGAPAGRVTQTLALTTFLWMALALVLTAAALPQPSIRWALCAGGTAMIILLFALIVRRFDTLTAIGFLLVRAGTVAATITGLWLAFQSLGLAAPIEDAAILSGAGLIGASAGIAPAGLGVSEAAGAGLATLRDASPASAVLALALTRVVGLVGNGLVAVVATGLRRSPTILRAET